MLRPIATAIALASTLGTAVAADAGRYQLFQGQYDQIDLSGNSQTYVGMFRIDTATGKIEQCAMRQWYIGDPKEREAVMALVCSPVEDPIKLSPSLIP